MELLQPSFVIRNQLCPRRSDEHGEQTGMRGLAGFVGECRPKADQGACRGPGWAQVALRGISSVEVCSHIAALG